MSSQNPVCPNCGTRQRRPDAQFCQNCGYPLTSSTADPSEKGKPPSINKTAPWLWLVLTAVLGLAVIAAIFVFGPGRKFVPCCRPTKTEVAEDIRGTHAPTLASASAPRKTPQATNTSRPSATPTSTPAPIATPTPPSATSTPTKTPVPPTIVSSPTPPSSTPIVAKLVFIPLSIKQIANSNTQEGYRNPPLGQVTLGGVPFDLDDGESVVTQANPLPGHPTFVTIPAGVSSPQTIYLLLTGGNLFISFDDQKLGKVNLVFDNGETYAIPLIAGNNIREWKHFQNNVVSHVSSPLVTEVWRGGNNDDSGVAVLDMLRIDVPPALRTRTLVSIELSDQTQQTVGQMDPAINLDGVTVASLIMIPALLITKTSTPRPTATPTRRWATDTSEPTNTPHPPTATPWPTNTPRPTATPTRRWATDTPTPTPPWPTDTPTPEPTSTPYPPTSTPTPEPTSTPYPPTSTPTPEPTSTPYPLTSTPTPEPTSTPYPLTSTPTP